MGEALIVRRGGGTVFEPEIETGLIAMFFGTSTNVPSGWALCDGTNGNPNLEDQFIIGAGDNYTIGNTGGNADSVFLEHNHNVSVATGGSHSHTISASNVTGGSFGRLRNPNGIGATATTSLSGSHSHSTITVESQGVDGTDKNLPPYNGVLYIIKEAN
jgi:microcystin-dependent protein